MDANDPEALWKASTRRAQEKRRDRNRVLWHAWHLDQAEMLRRTMASLIAAHEEKAASLEVDLCAAEIIEDELVSTPEWRSA